MAHVERHVMRGKIAPLRGVVCGKKGIEKASKVSVEDEADVAYSDMVIESARRWLP